MCHCSLLLRKLGESVRLANIRTLCCYRIYICFESSSKNYSDLFSQRKNSLLLNLSEIPYPELNRCYYKNCEIVDNFVDKNQHISFISFFLYTQRKIDLVLRSKFYPIIFKIHFQKSFASFLRPRATKIPFQNVNASLGIKIERVGSITIEYCGILYFGNGSSMKEVVPFASNRPPFNPFAFTDEIGSSKCNFVRSRIFDEMSV